jgi:hypothetical protein
VFNLSDDDLDVLFPPGPPSDDEIDAILAEIRRVLLGDSAP